MKEIMIGALLLFSMTAKSAVVLKKVELKRECTVSAVSTVNNEYSVEISRKIRELKMKEVKTYKLEGLARAIALAFNATTSRDVVNFSGTSYSAVHSLPVRDGTEDIEFNLHPKDSGEAMSLVFMLNELCR